jgi:putative ABC transport system substrate-binding protein
MLKLSLQSHEVRGADDFDTAFAAIARDRPDALLPLADPLINSEGGRIVEFAAKNRLPSIYNRRSYVEAGGLIAYGVSPRESYRRAAWYMDKILKGAKPAELPTKFELVVNLKTARALGLTIPTTVLVRADEVIE